MPRPSRLSAVAVVCAAAVALGACGGDDKADVEQVVKDFATAATERDGEKFCGLVTQEFLEQTTGAKGDAAKDACKTQIEQSKGVTVEVKKIKRTEINGDRAKVTAQLVTQGQEQEKVFLLQKEDGDFRLTASTGR